MAAAYDPGLERPVSLVDVESRADLERRALAEKKSAEDLTPWLTLREEARRVLARFPSQFRSLALTGKSRGGKSTIANLLLAKLLGPERSARVLDAFEARGGGEPVTSGIFFWGNPVPLPDGTHLLLLDTEGTERGNDTLTAQLTAISCMASAHLVMHVIDSLSNTDITALARLAHTVQVTGSAEDMHSLFPASLTVVSRSISDMWLLEEGLGAEDRDGAVHCDLGSEDVQEALDALLGRRLNQDAGDGHDESRQAIREMFPRVMYAVTRTAEARDIRLLRQTPERRFPELDAAAGRSPFAASVEAMMGRLLRTTEIKILGGARVSPAVFVRHLEKVVELLNRRAVHLPSVISFVHQQQAEELMEAVLAQYPPDFAASFESEEEFGVQFAALAAEAEAALGAQLEERKILDRVRATILQLLRTRMDSLRLVGQAAIQQRQLANVRRDVELERARNVQNEENIRALEARAAETHAKLAQTEEDNARVLAEMAEQRERLAQAQRDLEAAGRRGKKRRCAVM